MKKFSGLGASAKAIVAVLRRVGATLVVALASTGVVQANTFGFNDVFVASDKTAEGQIYRINSDTGAVSTFRSNYTAGDILFYNANLLAWNNATLNVDRFDANGSSTVFIGQSQLGSVAPQQFAYDSSGQFYFADWYGTLKILSSPSANARTPVYASSISGVAIDDSGNAFIRAVTGIGDAVYKVSAAQLAGADYSVNLNNQTPFFLASDLVGYSGLSSKLTYHDGYLFLASTSDTTQQSDWYRVDPFTGQATLFAQNGGSVEIDFSVGGQAFSVSWAEPSTAGGTAYRTTWPTSGQFTDLANGLRTPFSVATVPEPSTWAMAGMGSLMMGWQAWRARARRRACGTR